MSNRQLFTFLAVGLGLYLALDSVFVVDVRERALVRQLGEIVGTEYAPGLHFKLPLVQDVQRFDGRLLTLDNQTENFLTLEKKNVKVDFFVKWRIADTGAYYEATRGEESGARMLLTASVNRGLRDQFASRESIFFWSVRSHIEHRREWPARFAGDPRFVRLRTVDEARRWFEAQVADRPGSEARGGDDTEARDAQLEPEALRMMSSTSQRPSRSTKM